MESIHNKNIDSYYIVVFTSSEAKHIVASAKPENKI